MHFDFIAYLLNPGVQIYGHFSGFFCRLYNSHRRSVLAVIYLDINNNSTAIKKISAFSLPAIQDGAERANIAVFSSSRFDAVLLLKYVSYAPKLREIRWSTLL